MSFLGRARESGESQIYPNIFTSFVLECASQRVTSVDHVVIRLEIPNVLERETQISLVGQTIKCSQIMRIATVKMVPQIEQFVFSPMFKFA